MICGGRFMISSRRLSLRSSRFQQASLFPHAPQPKPSQTRVIKSEILHNQYYVQQFFFSSRTETERMLFSRLLFRLHLINMRNKTPWSKWEAFSIIQKYFILSNEMPIFSLFMLMLINSSCSTPNHVDATCIVWDNRTFLFQLRCPWHGLALRCVNCVECTSWMFNCKKKNFYSWREKRRS